MMADDREGLEFIVQFFQGLPSGYLIDVGAHDGVEIGSMSRALIEKGWKGLMVEPLPAAFQRLEKAYKGSPGITCSPAACSDVEGEAELFPCGGVSTLDPKWRDACESWWPHVQYGATVRVKKRTLANLLRECGAPAKVNYLQVDTEGHDLEVLRGMDWGRAPSLVCVETLNMLTPNNKDVLGRWLPKAELQAYLESLGYQQRMLTVGGNGIYIRKDRA